MITVSELFQRHNLVGFSLKILGLIVIGWGIISGFIIITDYQNDYGYVPILALTTFFTPILIGLLIIGFGELIDLVHKIVYGKNPTPSDATQEEEQSISPPTIPFYAEQEITTFYTNQNEQVERITPTTARDVFKVTVNDRIEYVEVGGFTPKVLTEEEAERFTQ